MANKKVSSKKKKSQPRGNQNAPQNEAPKKKEEKRDVVTLEFDDGKEQECFVEGVFDCGGQDYISLVPDNKSGDVYIYKYIQDDITFRKFTKESQIVGQSVVPERNHILENLSGHIQECFSTDVVHSVVSGDRHCPVIY